MNNKFERSCVSALLLKLSSLFNMKSEKVGIVIPPNTDHIETLVNKDKCKDSQVKTDLSNAAKIVITHIALGLGQQL